MTDYDDFGWPIRMMNGKRVCARPGPGHYSVEEEHRIDGYCSCECRDIHALERDLDMLREKVERARSLVRARVDDILVILRQELEP